jgi:hypothetical protein
VTSDTETGDITGTKDKDYIIIWFTEACLSNALRLETHIQDAERAGDTELADFFRRARQKVARCRAEQAASSCRLGSYQGETWILDSPEGACAGQGRFEYLATFVLFSNLQPTGWPFGRLGPVVRFLDGP